MLFDQAETGRQLHVTPHNAQCGPSTYFQQDNSKGLWDIPGYRFGRSGDYVYSCIIIVLTCVECCSGRAEAEKKYINNETSRMTLQGKDSPGPAGDYNPQIPRYIYIYIYIFMFFMYIYIYIDKWICSSQLNFILIFGFLS